MSLKTILNYSPNFYSTKRTPKQIKFIIFHYTGMKKESEAINRLTDINSNVSSHYLIKNNGEIVTIVPDLYIAWHAGVSFWKNNKSLNKNSIGIEISNPGHEFNYKKYSKKQILSILKLTKFLIKKYKIKSQNILGHSDVAPTRKNDPGEKFPWKYLSKHKIGYWHKLDNKILLKKRIIKTNESEKKLFFDNVFRIGYPKNMPKNFNINKVKYLRMITKSFQRRFRQEVINGLVDQECLIISQNLVKKLY
ncbi:N-acetylmuramoyl-L-alanine amidase [Candidatus Pelagibacter bacterium nBUS_32]|jgi:N-acetylmuramoyl-L-alanine amidase|uniref:N-acetylmuramoyl-L-alanine amidase n=1 Tax=Candidatus Pelagibacter bacterium nBUS_32 TaxID=3374192 RepID=UPI003EB9CF42